jgi:multiple sugar transport system ATP-binding protein
MATVSLRKINRQFGQVVVIEDLSLQIADREFIVLLGPSGCGKTTTMRMIAGLDSPTSGDIFIDDVRVNDKPARDRDLAMVFQNYGLYPHMTVAGNVGYPLKVRGVPRAERDQRVQMAAEKTGLAGLLHRRPSELSGGQRQRVALARAIVRTPRLFLMDEPLSNLDAKLRIGMRAQIKHLQRDFAATTVYVTHDQAEAMTLADRVVIMNGGKIEQEGAPADVYDMPISVFVAGFMGSPPMNLIEGTLEAGRFQHEAGGVDAVPTRDAGRVILGQRPEDLRRTDAAAGDLVGEVFSSEFLGDFGIVAVRIGRDIVNVKVDPKDRPTIGEPIGLLFDRSRLHVFDSSSGRRLGR